MQHRRFAFWYRIAKRRVLFDLNSRLTPDGGRSILELMQLNGKSGKRLADLRRGEQGVIAGMDLPNDIARRLMELGFLPGGTVRAGRSAPGGDPRVFEVDGSEVALRRETSSLIHVEG